MENENTLMFSVVVLTYNQEQFLKQTIDSIIQQRHNYRYELIISDDCSSDNSQRIIAEYYEKYPEIIVPVYNRSNQGLIRNYFNTLSKCKGKYIMECGGDDYWLPHKVEMQIEFMETHPEKGLVCSYAQCYNQRLGKIVRTRMGSPRISEDELILENHVAALTVCYRRELLIRYIREIRPEEKKWQAEDYPMWLWFSQNSDIGFLNKDLAVYRMLENTISHPTNLGDRMKFEKSMYHIAVYFSRNGMQLERVRCHYKTVIASLKYYYGDFDGFSFVLDHWSAKEVPLQFKVAYFINHIPLVRTCAWLLFRRIRGVV